ncbi:MAG: formylglycine-generating enzyme family protein [Bradymonadia bacterium]
MRARHATRVSVWSALLILVGCSVGKTPPEATVTVYVEGQSQFLLGNDAFAPCERFKYKDGRLSLPANEAIASERLRYETVIEPFCIDRHEVTILQYEHCVLRGTCEAPKITNIGSLNRSDAVRRYWSQREMFADYPVVGIEWSDAQEYCEFRGGRLPTEVEWEYVAKGGVSNQVTTLDENILASIESDCNEVNARLDLGSCSSSILSVTMNTADDNGFGVVGLHSGVSEWTADEYDPYVGCAQNQGDLDDEALALSDLFCDVDDRLYRRPVETLLSESDDACLSASADGVNGSCELAQHFQGECHESFKACYTECGHASGSNEELGQSCLTACFEAYEACANDCLHPESLITCVRMQLIDPQGEVNRQSCFPEPLCRRRGPRNSRQVHAVPSFARREPMAHVVKGANFQTDLACEVRATKRTGANSAGNLIGFRCAFDVGTPSCAVEPVSP